MAIIYSYPGSSPVKPTDRILASDTTQTGNPTINITVGGISDYILDLIGIGSGTPGTMPVWVTSSQLGNSYVTQVATPTPTTTATENIVFAKDATANGDLYANGSQFVVSAATTTDLLERVNIGTVGTTNSNSFQVYNTTQFYGDIRDTAGNIGTNTQVLSSLGAGSGVEWVDQLPSGLNFKGTWNADLNIPALASGVGVQGDYYIVSHDGTTNLDGFNSWEIGDWAIFNGTVWQEIDNQNIFSGTGTTNTMTKWTGTQSLGNSSITDDGVSVIVPTDIYLQGSTIQIGNAPTDSSVINAVSTFQANARFNSTLQDVGGAPGTAGQVLSSTGTSVTWIDVSAAAGALSGSGTLNTVPKWTPSGTELGDSSITDDGVTVSTATNVSFTGTTNDFGGGGSTNQFFGLNYFYGNARFDAQIRDNTGSPGSSGQVLVSNGAGVNWTNGLALGDGSRQITVSVDFNELGNLATTPKQLIPAQGAGTVIEILGVAFKYDYDTVVYDFTADLIVCPDGFIGNTDTYQAVFKQSFINGVGDIYQGNELGALTYSGKLMKDNTSMILGTPGIDPTQGDGTMRLNIRYRVLDISTWTVITT